MANLNNPICYYIPETDLADPSKKEVRVGIIEANEPGWHLLNYTWSKPYAVEARNEQNDKLGLTPGQVEAIKSSSMFPGNKYPENYEKHKDMFEKMGQKERAV